MIISLAFGKGGVGKSTLAHCLAHSPTIRKRGPVGLIDMDPQGTLTTIMRDRGDRETPIRFAQVLGEKPANAVRAVAGKSAVTILDVPGHHGFAAKFAVAVSDLVIVPCRSSLPDEAALAEQLWPYLRQQKRPDLRVVVIPTMVHPQSRPETHRAYFRALLPDAFEVCAAVFPARSVYENYHRGGLSLWEYGDTVKTNQRAHGQALRAQADIEAIAREIVK